MAKPGLAESGESVGLPRFFRVNESMHATILVIAHCLQLFLRLTSRLFPAEALFFHSRVLLHASVR